MTAVGFALKKKRWLCPCFGYFVFSALTGTMAVPEMYLRPQTKEQSKGTLAFLSERKTDRHSSSEWRGDPPI